MPDRPHSHFGMRSISCPPDLLHLGPETMCGRCFRSAWALRSCRPSESWPGPANGARKTWQSGAVRLVNRIPPVWLVISGIISVQFGAAIAKDLFHLIPPTAMVWLRLISSAAILLIMVRPRLTRPLPARLARGSRVRPELDDDELGDLPVLRADTARCRGDHRVPRSACGRRRGFPSLHGSDLGGARGNRSGAPRAVSRATLDVAGVGFALLAGLALGLLHPAECANRVVAGRASPA